MKNTDGALLGLFGGCAYLVFAFTLGWEAGGLVSSIVWTTAAFIIIFAAITPVVFWIPTPNIWIYPLSFALPTLLVGLLALTGGVFIVVIIGSATFLVGLSAALVARKLAGIYRPRSNPPLNTDARQETPRAG